MLLSLGKINQNESKDNIKRCLDTLIEDFFGEAIHTSNGMDYTLKDNHIVVRGCEYGHSEHSAKMSESIYYKKLEENMYYFGKFFFKEAEKLDKITYKVTLKD